MFMPLLGERLEFATCKTTTSDSGVKVVDGTVITKHNDISRSTVGIIGKKVDPHKGCTGTLVIDRRHALTAWHCVDPLTSAPNDKLGVTFGFSRLTPDKTIWASILAYGGNSGGLDNDIVLLTMDEDAPLPYVPVPLLPTSATLTSLETITVAGYGVTSGYDSSYATAGGLRMTDVAVHTINTHNKTFREDLIRYNSDYIPPKGSCHGDSGGPNYIRKNGVLYLAGVTHMGSDICDGGTHVMDIRHFNQWVKQAIAGNPQPTKEGTPPSFWRSWQTPNDPPIPYCHKYSDFHATAPFSTSEPELNGPDGKCRAYDQ